MSDELRVHLLMSFVHCVRVCACVSVRVCVHGIMVYIYQVRRSQLAEGGSPRLAPSLFSESIQGGGGNVPNSSSGGGGTSPLARADSPDGGAAVGVAAARSAVEESGSVGAGGAGGEQDGRKPVRQRATPRNIMIPTGFSSERAAHAYIYIYIIYIYLYLYIDR